MFFRRRSATAASYFLGGGGGLSINNISISGCLGSASGKFTKFPALWL